MKICSHCHEQKPLSDFCLDKKTDDGRSYWCRECSRAYNREYYRKRKSGAYIRPYGHKYSIVNPKPKTDKIKRCKCGKVLYITKQTVVCCCGKKYHALKVPESRKNRNGILLREIL